MTNPMRRGLFPLIVPRSGSLAMTAAAALLVLSVAACSHTSPAVTSAKTTAAGQSGSLLALAEGMAARGEHTAALPLFRAAHAKDSGDAEPLIGLGRSLTALGQYVEAEAAFRQAAGADDDSADAHAGLGMALLALGQPEAADSVLDAALALSPTHPEALRGKALCADLLGRHEDAIAVYRRALDSDGDVRLRNNYGLSLALHGAPEDGIAVLEAIVRDEGGGAAVRQNLALAYALAGDQAKSTSLLAVDLDAERTAHQMAFFTTLSNLPPQTRLYALMNGGKFPQRDLNAPGYERFADGQGQRLAAVAVVGAPPAAPEVAIAAAPEPTPEPAPEPAAEPVSTGAPIAQADADLSDIPLLDARQGWALQLAAYRKASQLKAGWETLKTRNADVIGHLPPRRTEIDFGARQQDPRGFYYRLNAGPLTDRAEAEALCATLKERGAECWVRPPESNEGQLPASASAEPKAPLS